MTKQPIGELAVAGRLPYVRTLIDYPSTQDSLFLGANGTATFFLAAGALGRNALTCAGLDVDGLMVDGDFNLASGVSGEVRMRVVSTSVSHA